MKYEKLINDIQNLSWQIALLIVIIAGVRGAIYYPQNHHGSINTYTHTHTNIYIYIYIYIYIHIHIHTNKHSTHKSINT
jgi:hypothetical protein